MKPVAQGLAAILSNEWVAGVAHDFNVVKVSIADIRVHEGQADGFYKVAGQVGRLATRRDPTSANSVDLGHAGFTIESTLFAPNWSLDNTGSTAKNPY